jgi:urease beta subunit
MKPGEVIVAGAPVRGNAGRGAITVTVENTSDHVVYVTSHYHFMEANKRLRFDRGAAYGRRLDIPAGSGVRWMPGEVKGVTLVEIGGGRRVFGFQGLVDGPLSIHDKTRALERARRRGFLDAEAV